MNIKYKYEDYIIMENLEKRLETLYPLFYRGIVDGLKEKDFQLYVEIRAFARKYNVGMKALLADWGYIYVKDSLKNVKADDKKSLKEFYRKVVKADDLIKNHYQLYYRILSHCKYESIPIEEYITNLGFEYDKYETNSKESYFKRKLKKIANEKNEVCKLSMKDNKLYSKIYKVATRKNMSIQEYTKTLGFKLIERGRNYE